MLAFVSISKTWLIAAVLLLPTLLAIGASTSPAMHGSRHKQPVHMRRRGMLVQSQSKNADRLANASRSQQKQFKIDQPRTPASGKMIFMKRASVPLHKRTYTDREIHDDYENQQHQLEAALEHYVTYGDSDSLQRYLSGFKAPSDKAAAQNQQPQQSAHQNQQKSAPSSQPDEECEEEDKSSEQTSASSKSQSGQKNPQQPAKKQPQGQQQHQQQQQQQQKPSGQKEQQSNAKTQQQQPKSETHQENTKSQGSTGGYGGGNNAAETGNTVWGYTPPSFNSAAAPATVSLYAASSTPFKGHATFYGTGMGACGVVNSDDQPIVAVSRDIFEQYNPSNGNPNQNSLCGRRLEISWNGKTQQAFAMDECPGCKPSSLDLSPNLFKALDNPDKGDLDGITWKFV